MITEEQRKQIISENNSANGKKGAKATWDKLDPIEKAAKIKKMVESRKKYKRLLKPVEIKL